MKRFLLFLSFVFFSLNIYSQTDSVLIWADKMPEFNGGLQALNDSIISNIAKENVVFDGIRTGTINLKTIVLKNGTVGEVEVVRGIDSVFDIAASNAVKKLTGFSPGMQNGQPVNVYYSFPLKIIVDSSVQSQRQPNIDCDDETLPEYPGGVVQLKEDIDANLFYPKVAKRKNIQGTVYVKFIVTTTGDIGVVELVVGVHPLLDAEAIRVVQTLQKFKPATKCGNPVSFWLPLPINFSL